ncbi:MAG: Fe-S protein assembly chaperone HscA [Candidatus Manganitrophaceae bacterium]|nr:MAG: Fe-S protein assembly chaperone HscA [Candidatus Manganitrophaceae bacterium]
MPRVVGIDLGTTNSLVAYMEGGAPRVISDAAGRTILPSVVSFGWEGRPDGVIVGEEAKEHLITHPGRTIYSIKRFMGKGMEDVGNDRSFVPYALTGGQQEVVRISVAGKLYTPPEISAFILRELKHRAEAFFKEPVRQAVITVPAYFNDSQRQATKDAGKIAGLEVLRIVNEPTAASLAYGLQKKKEGTVVVYDLGGGTFDVSILKIKNGIFEVLSTNGDTHLGGDDVDQQLMRLIVREISDRSGIDLSGAPEALQEIRLVSEKAKCQLSFEEKAEIVLTFPDKKIDYRRTISRTEFDALITEFVEKTLGPCRQALADAHLKPDQVDEVILVGGSTRIPLVRKKVAELFKKTPHSELNPDEVVALGAAVQADILAGGITNMLLLDVTPLSLGIETMGGVVSRLIPRNTTIPTSAKEAFTTFVDGQKSVSIHVVQGERELVKDCRSLAKFNLTEIDPMPAGIPRIEVTFMIDANGILNVNAKELRSGKTQSIEVKPTYGLTDGEVEKMISDSIEHAREDLNERMFIEARNEAESVLRHAEKALSQGAALIDPSEKAEIEKSMAGLKEAMNGNDHHRVREALDRLDQSTKNLAETLMNQTLKEALQEKKLSDL